MQGYGPKCGQVLGSGITRQDKEEILRVHNELRAKVAQGEENRGKPGPQPPAADMEQMVKSLFFVLIWFLAFSTFVLYHQLLWFPFIPQCLKITQNVAFEFLNFGIFPPIFHLLKLTCLVTLFDCKL